MGGGSAEASALRPSAHGGSKIAYQPALDGLRGVAIALVLVFHHGLLTGRPSLHGGFLGVDVFFVLSGYLITSLLRAEYASTGHISLSSFWARRARRLLPAVLALLVGVALYSVTIAAPRELHAIRGDAIATLLYVENWHLILGRNASVLSNTWSLSVEEQWYLIWPALFALLIGWRRARPRSVVAIIAGLAATSAVWTYVLHRGAPSFTRTYYGTDTRAQELLIGAALAVASGQLAAPTGRQRRLVELIGVAGAVGIVAMVVTSHVNSGFLASGGSTLFALAVAAVITASVQESSAIIRPVLSVKPLRALGLISYGLYLFHEPIYAWLTPDRTHTSGATLLLIRVAVCVCVATASLLLLERPIRRGALKGATLRIAAPAAIAALVVLTFVTTRPPPPSLVPDSAIASYRSRAHEPGTRVLVVGHGLAFELDWAGGAHRREGWNTVSVGFLDCSFIPGAAAIASNGVAPEPSHCRQLLPTLGRLRDAFRPDAVVLIPGSQELFDRRVGSRVLHVGTNAWATYARVQLEAAIHETTPTQRTPVLITTAPCDSLLSSTAAARSRLASLNAFLATFASAHRPEITLGDLDGRLCRGDEPIRSRDGRQIVDRKGALTPDGARDVWAWITGQLPIAGR